MKKIPVSVCVCDIKTITTTGVTGKDWFIVIPSIYNIAGFKNVKNKHIRVKDMSEIDHVYFNANKKLFRLAVNNNIGKSYELINNSLKLCIIGLFEEGIKKQNATCSISDNCFVISGVDLEIINPPLPIHAEAERIKVIGELMDGSKLFAKSISMPDIIDVWGIEIKKQIPNLILN